MMSSVNPASDWGWSLTNEIPPTTEITLLCCCEIYPSVNRAQAIEFAAGIFAEADTIEAVVVASEMLRDKRSPSTARRRLERLLYRTRELVTEGRHSEAEILIEATEWTGPPMLWWCGDGDRLADVLLAIYDRLEQNNWRDGYSVSMMDGRVALLSIWIDR